MQKKKSLFYKKFKKNLKEIYLNLLCLKNITLSHLFPNRYFLLKAAVKYKYGRMVHNNWGDDINFVFLNMVSSKKGLYFPDTKFTRKLSTKTFLCVGSTITFYPLKNTTIWGSGIINKNALSNISSFPDKICAVRGPRTREELIKLGIDCPAIYGDPIILLPRFYTPAKNKTHYRIGIIPHYIDKDKSQIKEICKKFKAQFIQVRGYKDWREFVDNICSCDYVISSSLHGLIIAEAYGIPSVWVKFGEYIDGWDFKFIDFYESLEKYNVSPIIINEREEKIKIREVENLIDKWEPSTVDFTPLLDVCPFK